MRIKWLDLDNNEGEKTWNPNWRGISSLKQFYSFFWWDEAEPTCTSSDPTTAQEPSKHRCTWPGDTPQEKTVLQRVTWPWALGKPRTSWGSELSLFILLPDGLANTTAWSSGKGTSKYQKSQFQIPSLSLWASKGKLYWRGGREERSPLLYTSDLWTDYNKQVLLLKYKYIHRGKQQVKQTIASPLGGVSEQHLGDHLKGILENMVWIYPVQACNPGYLCLFTFKYKFIGNK